MKILLVPNSYPPQVGGLERVAADLAEELVEKGHNINVVTCVAGHSKKEIVDSINVFRILYPVPRPPFKKMNGAYFSFLVKFFLWPIYATISFVNLAKIIQAMRPDIVNLHYIGDNALYVIIMKILMRFKLVVSVHELRRGNRRLGRNLLIRITLGYADKVTSISRYSLASARRFYPQIERKCTVIGDGIHLDQLEMNRSEIVDYRYILSARRFTFTKGVDILVRAFQLVHEKFPNLRLVLTGDGPEMQRCKDLAARCGIKDFIDFFGFVERSMLMALYKGCELFVLPSRKEGFGIALLEAMAAGKPIVATRVGGVPEVVKEGENAILVEPESPRALAEGIIHLLKNSNLADRFGKRGMEIVKNFTWDKIVRKYIAVYNSVNKA